MQPGYLEVYLFLLRSQIIFCAVVKLLLSLKFRLKIKHHATRMGDRLGRRWPQSSYAISHLISLQDGALTTLFLSIY